jgi:hypothetical protein
MPIGLAMAGVLTAMSMISVATPDDDSSDGSADDSSDDGSENPGSDNPGNDE